MPEISSARSSLSRRVSAEDRREDRHDEGEGDGDERQDPCDGDRGDLDPLAADGVDHDPAPGAGNDPPGRGGDSMGGPVAAGPAATSVPERYSWAPAVACRKASSSDAVCGDSSWSTAPTRRRELTDLLDRQPVDVDAVGADGLVRGAVTLQELGEGRRAGRAHPHPPGGVTGDERVDRALLDEPAAADHDEVVGHEGDLGEQVAADEHGATLTGEVHEHVADPADALGVEAVGRLVEDDACAGRRAARRPGRALPHAERVAADLAPGHLGQPDQGRAPRRPATAPSRWSRPASAGGCGRNGPDGRSRRRAGRRPRSSGWRSVV